MEKLLLLLVATCVPLVAGFSVQQHHSTHLGQLEVGDVGEADGSMEVQPGWTAVEPSPSLSNTISLSQTPSASVSASMSLSATPTALVDLADCLHGGCGDCEYHDKAVLAADSSSSSTSPSPSPTMPPCHGVAFSKAEAAEAIGPKDFLDDCEADDRLEIELNAKKAVRRMKEDRRDVMRPKLHLQQKQNISEHEALKEMAGLATFEPLDIDPEAPPADCVEPTLDMPEPTPSSSPSPSFSATASLTASPSPSRSHHHVRQTDQLAQNATRTDSPFRSITRSFDQLPAPDAEDSFEYDAQLRNDPNAPLYNSVAEPPLPPLPASILESSDTQLPPAVSRSSSPRITIEEVMQHDAQLVLQSLGRSALPLTTPGLTTSEHPPKGTDSEILDIMSDRAAVVWDDTHPRDASGKHTSTLINTAFHGQPVMPDLQEGSDADCTRCVGAPHNTCNLHGVCVSGECVCHAGWKGADCGTRRCSGVPLECLGRGSCVNATCVCENGWTGNVCDVPVCAGTPPCSGHGLCVDKHTCQCDNGYTGHDCSNLRCPGAPECSGRGLCFYGVCHCDFGFHGSTCASAVCAGAPLECSGAGGCVNGTCACGPGWKGKDCSDRRCAGFVECSGRGQCIQGTCSCSSGWKSEDCSIVRCPGSPAECSAHGVCSNGVCVCSSEWYGDACELRQCPGFKNGTQCSGRGICQDAVCQCDDGWRGVDCTVRACDNDCSDHGLCSNGTCECDPQWKGHTCDIRTCPSDQGKECGGRGECVNGNCVCDRGWKGAACQSKACPGYSVDFPANECSGHGVCRSTGVCVCKPDREGPSCSIKRCVTRGGVECSGNGVCANGSCLCDEGWRGVDCFNIACQGFPECSSHGQCANGTCMCTTGWKGVSCSERVECAPLPPCPGTPMCGGKDHGVCNEHAKRCECLPGFTGADCTTALSSCNGGSVFAQCALKCTFVCQDNCTTALRPGLEYTCGCEDYRAIDDSTCAAKCTCPPATPVWDARTRKCVVGEQCAVQSECGVTLSAAGMQVDVAVRTVSCVDKGSTNCVCANQPVKVCWKAGAQLASSLLRSPQRSGIALFSQEGSAAVSVAYLNVTDDESLATAILGTTSQLSARDAGGYTIRFFVENSDSNTTTYHSSAQFHAQPCISRLQLPCGVGGNGEECSGNGDCRDGLCICNPGWVGGDCSLLHNCPGVLGDDIVCSGHGNCTGCFCDCENGWIGSDCSIPDCPNRCSGNGACIDGECQCQRGWSGTDCSRDTHSDACPQDLSGFECSNHGFCVGGVCECSFGWKGTACEEKVCLGWPTECSGKGLCIAGECICDAGWTGSRCNYPACLSTNNLECSGNGVCSNGICACNPMFTGASCSKFRCVGEPLACGGPNRGECVKGVCQCYSGWTGADCTSMTCPGLPECSGNGMCVNGSCVCQPTFHGSACDVRRCPGIPECSNNGKCVAGACGCDYGWRGVACETRSCFFSNDAARVDCSGHGVCVNGSCVCEADFTSVDCSVPQCSVGSNGLPCSANGLCENGVCKCFATHEGKSCSSLRCPYDCFGHGVCNNGTCLCDPQFTGSFCNSSTAEPTPLPVSSPASHLEPSPQPSATPARQASGTLEMYIELLSDARLSELMQKTKLVEVVLSFISSPDSLAHYSNDVEAVEATASLSVLVTDLGFENVQYGGVEIVVDAIKAVFLYMHSGIISALEEAGADSLTNNEIHPLIPDRVSKLFDLPEFQSILIALGLISASPSVSFTSSPSVSTSPTPSYHLIPSGASQSPSTSPVSLSATSTSSPSVSRALKVIPTRIASGTSSASPSPSPATPTPTPKCFGELVWTESHAPNIKNHSCVPTCLQQLSPQSLPDCFPPSLKICACPPAKPFWNHVQQKCMSRDTCVITCGAGVVDSTGACVCNPGYTLSLETKKCVVPLCVGAHDGRGECLSRGVCVNGKCRCNPGYTGDACESILCDPECSSHGFCSIGKCVCESGWTGASCQQATCLIGSNGLECSGTGNGVCNRTTGACNCTASRKGASCDKKICPLGLSGIECSGHGNCNGETGTCKCIGDWIGAACGKLQVTCSGHGEVGTQGTCACYRGFAGSDCSEKECPLGLSGEECSGNGICNHTSGVCACNKDYSGLECGVKLCPQNCSVNGWCNNGSCLCNNGWGGVDCAIQLCPSGCRGNGKCLDGACQCYDGWRGTDCSMHQCPGSPMPCSGKGVCVAVNGSVSQCNCSSGFTGDDCSLPLSAFPIRVTATPGGTVPAFSKCAFPFVYMGTSYTSCTSDWTTSENEGREWCSTTALFTNATWGFCAEAGRCVGSAGLECSGHGSCLDGANQGVCSCQDGWLGEGCQYPLVRVTTSSDVRMHTVAANISLPIPYSATWAQRFTTAATFAIAEYVGVPSDLASAVAVSSRDGSTTVLQFRSLALSDKQASEFQNSLILALTSQQALLAALADRGVVVGSVSLLSPVRIDSEGGQCWEETPTRPVAGCVANLTDYGVDTRVNASWNDCFQLCETNENCLEAGIVYFNNSNQLCVVGTACAPHGFRTFQKKAHCVDVEATEFQGRACNLPFTYRGRTFDDCTTEFSKSGREWCSVTSSFNQRWGYCAPRGTCPGTVPCSGHGTCNDHGICSCDSGYMGNDCATRKVRVAVGNKAHQSRAGVPCFFPFVYEGVTYNDCTTAPTMKGLPWCSVVGGSFDGSFQSWGFCASEGTCLGEPQCSGVGNCSSGVCECSLTTAGAACDRSASQDDVLNQLFAATNGDTWVNQAGWNRVDQCSGIFGATCSGNTVVSLELSTNGLSGTIPRRIGLLSSLKILDISGNLISGSIPTEIGLLKLLTKLDVSFNRLTGSLPTSLSQLTALQTLDVSHTYVLGGPVDALLRPFPSLTTFSCDATCMDDSQCANKPDFCG
eukprot:c12304_g1_i1.p1 GENE.c12304_g1_i1~~c12304_g1_i1.p1  ORF type:complete len:2890 (+),score=599.83 c12304_g1_i1:62-8731(+)